MAQKGGGRAQRVLWSVYTQVESSLLRAKLLGDLESLEFKTDFWNPGGELKLTEPSQILKDL